MRLVVVDELEIDDALLQVALEELRRRNEVMRLACEAESVPQGPGEPQATEVVVE